MAALEEGSKELRVAAIQCLGTSEEDLPFLLEQAKAKARDVREAALIGLARLNHKEAAKLLVQQISPKELDAAAIALRTTESREVLDALLKQTETQLGVVLGKTPKAKANAAKEVDYLTELLECLRGRADKASEALHMKMVDSIEQLNAMKHEDVVRALACNLSEGSAAMKKKLCTLHQSLSADLIVSVFNAAVDTWQPEQVFEEFSPYLADYAAVTGKKRTVSQQRGETLSVLLSGIQFSDSKAVEASGTKTYAPSSISKKWLELAIEKNLETVVINLSRLDKKKAWPALSAQFDKYIKAKSNSRDFWMLHGLINAMIDTEHPDRVDAMISIIKRLSDSTAYYYSTWLLGKISYLPAKEALPKLEAILPSLKDHVADVVISHLHILKHDK